MPSILSYTNAFPGVSFPQHTSGDTTTVQSYLYPGAVQPQVTSPAVLSYTNAFPGAAFPQHGSGQSDPQSYLYPGAVQPLQSASQNPFITADFPNPRALRDPVANRSHLLGFNTLAGQDRLYGGPGQTHPFDWPNPRGYVPGVTLKTHTDPSKVQLIGQDRIYGAPGEVPAIDAPNPTLRREVAANRSWLWNLLQTTLNIVASPFVPIDWLLPRGARDVLHNRTHLDWRRLGAVDAPIAGKQFDWPVPKGPGERIHNRTHADPLKLNILGKDTFFGAPGEPPKNHDFPNPVLSRDDKRRGWLFTQISTVLNIVSGGTTTPAAVFKGIVPQLVPTDIVNTRGWGQRVAKALNAALRGNIGAAGSVTLAATATTTTVYDSRILPTSHVSFTPLTADAATAYMSGSFYVVLNLGNMVIHHPSATAGDQNFSISVLN